MSSAEPKVKPADTEFEPTVEMMVDDFDDERTLEEEERLASMEEEDPADELNNLQKEGDMPIEQLLAMYYNRGPAKSDDQEEEEEDTKGETSTVNEEKASEADDEEPEEEEGESELKKLYPEEFATVQPIRLRTSSRPASEESDGDYSPDDDDCKKTIMVGSDFQAQIPEDFCRYDDALPYENKDVLVWDPTRLDETSIVDYISKANQIPTNTNTSNPAAKVLATIPTGKHLRDDEASLFLLQQCGHNVEEALRRRRISNVPPTEAMSAWSEEECRNFEAGLRMYGKDFHHIQLSKVKTRSVGELVQFYYLWKKTERHDVFANKARMDKKKYSLNPGLTDYMDRFLEDQEGTNGGFIGAQYRDRSSSPGFTSLLHTDSKRQRIDKQHVQQQQQQQPQLQVPPTVAEVPPTAEAETVETKPTASTAN